jgi:hypothetical protein
VKRSVYCNRKSNEIKKRKKRKEQGRKGKKSGLRKERDI